VVVPGIKKLVKKACPNWGKRECLAGGVRKKTMDKDFEQRLKDFNAELILLLGKYKIGLSAMPHFVQMQNGAFGIVAKPVPFDDSKPKAEEKKENNLIEA